MLDRRRLCQVACGGTVFAWGGDSLLGQEGKSWLTTEDRVAVAQMQFRMGFHCAQSILAAYAEDFGIDPDTALKLAAGLAGGSTAGGECGTVGAAYLILGLRHGRTLPAFGDVEKEAELFNRIKDFLKEFTARHGAITCRELLGIDVFTREGRAEGLRRNLFAERCPRFIRSSVEILEKLA
jgi:C_GCAxxG_C_C family probable redox protein